MADHIQILRRIGACENSQAQPDWTGPAIDTCPAPPAFLCETCGRMLCGGHAGGHWHAVSDSTAIASHFQDEAAKAAVREQAATANAQAVGAQLVEAQAKAAKLEQIRELIG